MVLKLLTTRPIGLLHFDADSYHVRQRTVVTSNAFPAAVKVVRHYADKVQIPALINHHHHRCKKTFRLKLKKIND